VKIEQYPIRGGDYEHAGEAAGRLKERLKRLGADPGAVRRAIIAAYEAETNVVIHAHRGEMQVALSPGRLEVAVTDEGPGIPDIERAMQEGFSTAPAAARELGFGAGMGLPNIRKSADRFAIESTVGRGTAVRFTVYLPHQEAGTVVRHSIRVVAERCRQCLRCVTGCPTQAVRLHDERPLILEHLCIDCGACVAACPAGAMGMAEEEEGSVSATPVLVVPAGFLVAFGPGSDAERVQAALIGLGFGTILVTEGWEAALREAALDFARSEMRAKPVIVPVCPAAVNLIEMRFPSLLGQVAPFLTPVEAANEQLQDRPRTFVAACPSQRTALRTDWSAGRATVLSPARVWSALQPLLAPVRFREFPVKRVPETMAPEVMAVSGARHVLSVLEQVENGLLGDVGVIEPYLCDQGCFGSALLGEDAFVARERWLSGGWSPCLAAQAIRRRVPFAARGGLRLDPDMARAMTKLARIDELTRALPGRDCARCGAPTCAALAEDVVLGRATRSACPFSSEAVRQTPNEGQP
jgi:anti-sigma regulatory factor (Ser/Thr protein kinase)/NAD-dependent dihydropyrimidine dehydrogenase PreA subunit